MTKNQLKINVFTKTFFGRMIAALEWSCLLAIIAFVVSYLLLPIINVEYHYDQAPSFTYNGITAMCSFLGLLIGLNIKASLIVWRIWPMNKKAAKKFIANQKKELENKITGRGLLIKAAEERFNNQIIIIDEEIEQNKTILNELIKLEESL
jgi:hypothetical protein